MNIKEIERNITGDLYSDFKRLLQSGSNGKSLQLHERASVKLFFLSGGNVANRFVVFLYDTLILRVLEDGTIYVNTHNLDERDDYRTVTTKRWLNRFLLPTGFRVYQSDGNWYIWSINTDTYTRFRNGLRLYPDDGAMFYGKNYVNEISQKHAKLN